MKRIEVSIPCESGFTSAHLIVYQGRPAIEIGIGESIFLNRDVLTVLLHELGKAELEEKSGTA